jgi:hypothetical protein
VDQDAQVASAVAVQALEKVPEEHIGAALQAAQGDAPVALQVDPATHGVLAAAHCGALGGAQAQEPAPRHCTVWPLGHEDCAGGVPLQGEQPP